MKDATTVESEVHPPRIDPVGVISEIINNITDERQVLRELLSNSAGPVISQFFGELKPFCDFCWGVAVVCQP